MISSSRVWHEAQQKTPTKPSNRLASSSSPLYEYQMKITKRVSKTQCCFFARMVVRVSIFCFIKIKVSHGVVHLLLKFLIRKKIKINPAAPKISIRHTYYFSYRVSFHFMHIIRLFWAYRAKSYFLQIRTLLRKVYM